MSEGTTVLTTIPSAAPAPAAPPAAEVAVDPVAKTEPAPSVPAAVESEPETDKNLELAQKFDALSRREAKARKQETEFQQRMAKIAEREKEMDAKLAELDAALDDPIEYHLKKGKDPVLVAQRFTKPLTPEQKQLKELQDRLDAKEKAEAEEKTKQETQRAEHTRAQAMKSFVSSITPDECPNLVALYEPHQVPVLVRDLLHSPSNADPELTVLEYFEAAHGRKPSDSEVRKALEHDAEARATRILSGQRSHATTEAQDSQAAPSATPGGPPSLSNQHAASSTTAPSARKKSREEVKRELAEALEREAAERNG